MTSFIEFFTLFTGILGQETKKFFTNTDAIQLTLDPIKENIAFYQTNKLLPRFEQFATDLQTLLDEGEFSLLRKQIEHMLHIFNTTAIVEKKMYARSDFYFTYAEEVKFTTRAEFAESFGSHKTLFLTNFDQTQPPLIQLSAQAELSKKDQNPDLDTENLEYIDPEQTIIDSKIFNLSKPASVLHLLQDYDLRSIPNPLIFILSVQKDQSKELFESMINRRLDQHFLLLVENIT